MNAKLTPGTNLSRSRLRRGDPGIGASVNSRSRFAVIANLKRVGRYLAKDACHLGNVPLQARTLLDQGCVTGPTVVERLNTAKRNEDQCVVRPVDQPLSATCGIDGRMGNIAPACAGVKVVAMAGLKLTGPARFEGEQACGGAVKNKKYREGKVLAIRYAGPHGGAGMRNVLAHGAVTFEVCHAEF